MKQNIVRIASILFIITALGTTFMTVTTLEEAEAETYHECYALIYHPLPYPPWVWIEVVRWEVRHPHLAPHPGDNPCTSS